MPSEELRIRVHSLALAVQIAAARRRAVDNKAEVDNKKSKVEVEKEEVEKSKMEKAKVVKPQSKLEVRKSSNKSSKADVKGSARGGGKWRCGWNHFKVRFCFNQENEWDGTKQAGRRVTSPLLSHGPMGCC